MPCAWLVMGLYDTLETDAGRSPITVCVQRLAISLAQVYLGERQGLDLPRAGVTLPPQDAAAS
jgi:CRISPR-associated protein Cas1